YNTVRRGHGNSTRLRIQWPGVVDREPANGIGDGTFYIIVASFSYRGQLLNRNNFEPGHDGNVAPRTRIPCPDSRYTSLFPVDRGYNSSLLRLYAAGRYTT